MKIHVDDIVVKKRIRKETGDLSDLIDSISRYGLFNPITVNEKNELLAGYRRLQACRALGITMVPCTVVEASRPLDKLIIESEENRVRKDFTFEEMMLFEHEKRYLTSTGVIKILLWVKRLWERLYAWLRVFFRGGTGKENN